MKALTIHDLRAYDAQLATAVERFMAGEAVVECVRDKLKFVLSRAVPKTEERQLEADAEGKEYYLTVEVIAGDDVVAECTTDIPGVHNLLWSKVPKLGQLLWDIKCIVDGAPEFELNQRVSGMMFRIKNGYIPIAYMRRFELFVSVEKLRSKRKDKGGDKLMSYDQQLHFLQHLSYLSHKSRALAGSQFVKPLEFEVAIRFKKISSDTSELYQALVSGDKLEIEKAFELLFAQETNIES